MKLHPFCALVASLVLTSAAHAQSSAKGDPEKDMFWHNLYLFVGGDVGYNYISTNDAAELNKHGYQLEPKGLLSYSWRDITADVGGGWLFNRSIGNASSGAVLRDKLTMKAGFARVAGRYRFTPHWEAGLLNRVLFGADTRFQTTMAQEKKVNWLMGPEVVYRIPFRFPVQLSGAFLTDLTVSSRQAYQFLFGVQVGFPIFYGAEKKPAPAPTPEPAPLATPEPTVIPTPAPTPTPQVILVPSVTRIYSFDLRRIQFDFDKSTIKPQSMPLLEELGSFLAKHPDAWDKLSVEGHADNTGPAAYNQKLSQARAESVRGVLIGQGAKESAVTAVGYGLTRPLVKENTREARRRNRRVEFHIEGVHQPQLMDEFFRKLNLNY
jgi:outer membrane protein OmpA-like peptidoglycan-associated protein